MMVTNNIRAQWQHTDFWDNKELTASVQYSMCHDMVKTLIPKQHGICLDLGTATGTTAMMLKENGYDVIASDSDIRALKKCKEKGLTTLLLDVEKDEFPYSDKSVDLITCIELIEHIKNPYNMLKETHRVLKPHGVFIISTPNINWWYLRLKHLFGIWDIHGSDHIRFYTPHILQECLKDFDFEVIKIKSMFIAPHITRFISPILHDSSYGFAMKCQKSKKGEK